MVHLSITPKNKDVRNGGRIIAAVFLLLKNSVFLAAVKKAAGCSYKEIATKESNLIDKLKLNKGVDEEWLDGFRIYMI